MSTLTNEEIRKREEKYFVFSLLAGMGAIGHYTQSISAAVAFAAGGICLMLLANGLYSKLDTINRAIQTINERLVEYESNRERLDI